MKKDLFIFIIVGIFVIVSICVAKYFFVTEAIHQTLSPELSSENISRDITQIEKLSFPDTVAYFETSAKEQGALYAYELLRQLPSTVHANRHLLGHVIGSILYEQMGTDGLRFCTKEFEFSCYHSVVASVIAADGFEVLSELNELCRETGDLWGCQHGIGHGLLAVTGYDEPFKALEICKTLSAEDFAPGCVEGVFMEFQLMIMVDSSGNTERELTDTGLYYPCDVVEEQFQNFCYYEQPAWWHGLFDDDSDEAYKKFGSLCEAVSDEESKDWCFRRIGILKLDAVDGTLEKAVDKCMVATLNQTLQAYCLQTLREQSESSSTFCDVLLPPYRDICQSPVPPR